MSLLEDAATSWTELSKYSYEMLYGKKKKLSKVKLSFCAEEFSHIAGFQYLDDIVLPIKGSSKAILSHILNGKITQSHIIGSLQYTEMVEPRLKAIIQLGHILDSDFTTYIFTPSRLPFFTEIKAKYLIVGGNYEIVFLFTDVETNTDQYYSCSTFVQDYRDYRTNQTSLALLKKEKCNILTGERTVLFKKPGFVEQELSFVGT